jgi:hypothetical protein
LRRAGLPASGDAADLVGAHAGSDASFTDVNHMQEDTIVTSMSFTVLPVHPRPTLAWTIFGRLRVALLAHLQHLVTPGGEVTFEPDGFSTPRPFVGDELWRGH